MKNFENVQLEIDRKDHLLQSVKLSNKHHQDYISLRFDLYIRLDSCQTSPSPSIGSFLFQNLHKQIHLIFLLGSVELLHVKLTDEQKPS